MQSKLRKLLIAAPLTILFSSAAWAQTGAIEGDVKGEDGKPLAGAVIKIERKDIKGNYNTKTDKKGHYYYGGLGLGVYDVSIEVNGKPVDAMRGVRAQGAPAEVNFDLKQAAARAAAAAGAGGAGAAAPPPEENRSLSPAQKAELEKQRKEQEERMAKSKELNDAFNAGRDAETAKNWDVAIQQYDKAAQLDPKQHVVWSHLADSYIGRAGSKTGADQQADYAKGIENYQKAIELKPDDPAYHNNYALVLAKAKNLDTARAELTKAASLDAPNAGKYYYNFGAILVNAGQNDAAGDAFKKAIEVDPNYADAYYQLGIVMIGKATTTPEGKVVPPAGTQEQFQKYLSLQPNGPNADAAKAMLASMGASVETTFQKPGSKNAKKK
ncbi:MAG TPA: tetratricopeptide repeat protein [Bryobacteraceae bacterium]|jgi:tetratricopeptide (TPR) repeat protein